MEPTSDNPEHAGWEDKIAAVEVLFRKLPVQNTEKASGIPYAFLIPGIGRQLMQMRPSPPPNHLSGKKALRELVESTGRALEALDRLPQSAIDLLNFRQTALRKLTTNLRILHAVAHAGLEEVEETGINFRDGAPKKTQAREIAIVVATHYCGLTGKKPTLSKRDGKIYGQFFELLKAVYKILGVKASPESQASGIIKDWTSIAAEITTTDYRVK